MTASITAPQRSNVVRQVTDEEVASFRKNGWAHLPGLVDPGTIAEMLAFAKAYLGEDGRSPFPHDRAPASVFVDAPFWRDWRFLARDGLVEPFRSLAFSSRLGENAHILIGRDVATRYDLDGILCKVPEGGELASTLTAWHQDFPNLSQDRVGFMLFWIALHDIPPERGSMRFLSGSHREGPRGRTLRGGDDLVTQYPHLAEQYEVSPPLTLKAGDATCHDSLVVHSAPANSTSSPRFSFSVSFFPDDACYTGAQYSNTDDAGLEVGLPFDVPQFPIVFEPN